MHNPCFECWNRYGHSYTEECDNTCDYAISIAKRNNIIEYLLDLVEEEHVGMRSYAIKEVKNRFGIEF